MPKSGTKEGQYASGSRPEDFEIFGDFSRKDFEIFGDFD